MLRKLSFLNLKFWVTEQRVRQQRRILGCHAFADIHWVIHEFLENV